MGLDMYVERAKKGIDTNGNPFYGESEELIYWRKANQIRQWFVNNTDLEYEDDCKVIELSKDTLEKLIEDCQNVLADHSLAREIMPPSEGFFFGDTEIDEWYFRDIEHTLDEVKNIVLDWDELTKNGYVVYYTEWW